GDPALQFDACYWGSITCLLRNEPDHARHLIGLGLSLARATGNTLNTGRALAHLADIIRPTDPEAARSALHESLAIFGDLHDDFREAISLRLLGMLSVQQGDYDAAFAFQMDALSIWERTGHRWGVPISLRALAEIAVAQGDLATARSRFKESLELWNALGERLHMSDCCTGLARIGLEAGLVEESVLLLGAQARLDEETGYRHPGEVYRLLVAAARAAVPAERFAALWEEGKEMPLEAALEPILAADLAGVPISTTSLPRASG
ncbi:MAG TPA: tetratricopeptide repeat protein, partial [Thermomicrobiales bacterium]|nr:tetratricopeptide repeat protein [Thermomicrobiales bacterium]